MDSNDKSSVIYPSVPETGVEIPREETVRLPTLEEVAKVVTGSAKTGELVGLVREWRPGDREWACLVDGVPYARVDGGPIDSNTMWKAGFRPPFRFTRMGHGWKPDTQRDKVFIPGKRVDDQGRRLGHYEYSAKDLGPESPKEAGDDGDDDAH